MIKAKIIDQTEKAIKILYGQEIGENQIQIEKTNKDFSGDYTLVVFPFLRFSKKSPIETATEIGEFLKQNMKEISGYEVVKGFLNIEINTSYWIGFFMEKKEDENFGFQTRMHGSPVVIEYSSPNTNKPLHLGHVRNNLLGYSLSKILKANGKHVVKINLVNDRGIHICKSMLAWVKWGNGETPESAGMKGDHLIGKYYVMFDQKHKEEIAGLVRLGQSEDDAFDEASIMKEAKEMLKKWEKGDEEVLSIWKLMNNWAYEGFEQTYNRLGVDFDYINYESDTYLDGKKMVKEGLENGVFSKKDDGSVWVDLRDEGLDEKLLLRKDGTSVYITQDLGTAQRRYNQFEPEQLIYVVGNEQIYHFEVLKKILKKLGLDYYNRINHLSYGMVELPHGRMKSREGTVVDADDLMDEMFLTAKKTTEELGKTEEFTEEQLNELYDIVSMGALKYFILKVDPKKNMLFNPEESIDFNGNTGPFIQYTYARIQSIFRKAEKSPEEFIYELNVAKIELIPKEIEILKMLYDFPDVVKSAGDQLSPSVVANYVFELVKLYNHYYQDTPILKRVDPELANFRVLLSWFVGKVIKKSMGLLGIEVPERM